MFVPKNNRKKRRKTDKPQSTGLLHKNETQMLHKSERSSKLLVVVQTAKSNVEQIRPTRDIMNLQANVR
jgi:hypothetical protein